ncbi:hypothetical protein HK405_015304 [Cladochytrium tenue]|nr:hypothetical protein HK405_015304 [Cladochytrium tenue]
MRSQSLLNAPAVDATRESPPLASTSPAMPPRWAAVRSESSTATLDAAAAEYHNEDDFSGTAGPGLAQAARRGATRGASGGGVGAVGSGGIAGFSLKQCALLLLTVLPEVLIHHMLGPLFPYMVRFLMPDVTAIGYYTGLLQPVLLVGLFGYGIGTLLLGMSTAYVAAAFSLFVTGCFAGNTVVAKGMIGELATDDRSRALGYSAYGVVFGLAGIFGSLLGGFLANPELFTGVPFLSARPYLLACLVGFALAAVGIVMTMNLLVEARGAKGGGGGGARRGSTAAAVPASLGSYDTLGTEADEDDDEDTDLDSQGDDEDGAGSDGFEQTRVEAKGGSPRGANIVSLSFSASSALELESPRPSLDAKRALASHRRAAPDDVELATFRPDSTFVADFQADAEGQREGRRRRQRLRRHRRRSSSSSLSKVGPHVLPGSGGAAAGAAAAYVPGTVVASARRRLQASWGWMVSALRPYAAVASARTAVPIAMYTLFAFTNSLFHTALPLLAAAGATAGGLQLGPQQTAVAMAAMAAAKILVKAAFLPVHARLGTLAAFRAGAGLMLPAVLLVPLRLGYRASAAAAATAATTAAVAARDFAAGLHAGHAGMELAAAATNGTAAASAATGWGDSPVPFWPLAVLTATMGLGEGLAYLSVVMVITDSVSADQLGLVHGLAGCLASVARTVAPTLAGAIWEAAPPPAVFGLTAAVVAVELAASWFVAPRPLLAAPDDDDVDLAAAAGGSKGKAAVVALPPVDCH